MRVRTQKVLEIPFGIPYLAYYLIAELHNKTEATFFDLVKHTLLRKNALITDHT